MRNSDSRKLRLSALLASAALLVTSGLLLIPGTAPATGGSCTDYFVPVALTEGGPADQTMHGRLCLPDFGTPETVQVLVHGAGYNSAYWDFPYHSALYSYVTYANAAGYATFNVDLVGGSISSHPASNLVDLTASATVMHQVIMRLKAGVIGPIAFDKVIWVGHSLGVAIGWVEAATYGDIDALIATAMLHTLSPSGAGVIQSGLFPASQDPKFASLNLDPGYLAASEQARQDGFYHLPLADPNAIDVDFDNRGFTSVASQIELGTILGAPPGETVTRDLTIPVLGVLGGKDVLFCAPDALDCSDYAAVKQFEEQFYPNVASYTLAIIPQTGHALNTHYTAPFSFATMLGWSLLHAAP